MDVGSEWITTKDTGRQPVTKNKLTELYKYTKGANGVNSEFEDKLVLKISSEGSNSSAEAEYYEFTSELEAAILEAINKSSLKELTAEQIADLFKDGGALAKKIAESDKPYLLNNLIKVENPLVGGKKLDENQTLIIAGTSRDFVIEKEKAKDIKRLDSKWLEYADVREVEKQFMINEGNLTNDDAELSEVLANIKDNKPVTVKTEEAERGVLTGILNAAPVVVNGEITWPAIKDREYGVLVHETSKVLHEPTDFSELKQVQNYTYQEASSKITEDKIVVSKSVVEFQNKMKEAKDSAGNTIYVTNEAESTAKIITKAETVITAEGITTGKLVVGGVDVGQTIAATSVLGDLAPEDLDALVNSGTAIKANTTAITQEIADRIAGDEQTLKDANSYTDAQVQKVTADVTSAATTYTDTKTAAVLTEAKAEDVKTLKTAQDFAKAEDVKTLTSAQNFAKAEDVKTLTAANAYTDKQFSAVNAQFSNVNKRLDNIEETAYRGVAISLAAAQQVPNIKPGQFAVFGGVGHYEGESAVAFGGVAALADGRTSISAALGTAGSEVGGRVGVSYVFGGN